MPLGSRIGLWVVPIGQPPNLGPPCGATPRNGWVPRQGGRPQPFPPPSSLAMPLPVRSPRPPPPDGGWGRAVVLQCLDGAAKPELWRGTPPQHPLRGVRPRARWSGRSSRAEPPEPCVVGCVVRWLEGPQGPTLPARSACFHAKQFAHLAYSAGSLAVTVCGRRANLQPHLAMASEDFTCPIPLTSFMM